MTHEMKLTSAPESMHFCSQTNFFPVSPPRFFCIVSDSDNLFMQIAKSFSADFLLRRSSVHNDREGGRKMGRERGTEKHLMH